MLKLVYRQFKQSAYKCKLPIRAYMCHNVLHVKLSMHKTLSLDWSGTRQGFLHVVESLKCVSI